MSATIVSFRWLDILEKEFDKNFVDLDLILGEFEHTEDEDWVPLAKNKLESLSSCFAQLTHKALTIFQTNAKLEAELVNLYHELTQCQASCGVLKEESHEMLMKLHAAHLDLYTKGAINTVVTSQNVDNIRKRLEKEIEDERSSRMDIRVPYYEVELLRRENQSLRKQMVTLQSELSGARLTSKYLDKELAGRIQQIQLISRGDLKAEQHEKLWRQIEAEIHLHRHKTFVRAFRKPSTYNQNGFQKSKEVRQELQLHRFVTVNCPPEKEFGLSITGGKDYGLPILISSIHADTPAEHCGQFYAGDAILSVNGISLSEKTHAEAVKILSSQTDKMILEVKYVPPDEDDDDGSLAEDPFALKFRMFDEERTSMENGRLSRASIDSIRGSTDDIDGSPRKYAESNLSFTEDRASNTNDNIMMRTPFYSENFDATVSYNQEPIVDHPTQDISGMQIHSRTDKEEPTTRQMETPYAREKEPDSPESSLSCPSMKEKDSPSPPLKIVPAIPFEFPKAEEDPLQLRENSPTSLLQSNDPPHPSDPSLKNEEREAITSSEELFNSNY